MSQLPPQLPPPHDSAKPLLAAKRIPSGVYLIGCMLAGMGLTFLFRIFILDPRMKPPPSTPPAMRGFMPSANSSAAITPEWCDQLAHAHANWIMLRLPADASAPNVAADLTQAVREAHRTALKVVVFVKISAANHSLPLPLIHSAAATAAGAQADMLAIGPASAEEEDLDDHAEAQWILALAEAKKTFGGKVMYVSTVETYQSVSWWQHADLIGVAGPFPLSERMPPDRHALDVGWAAHLAVLESISRREGRPAVLVDVYYPATANAARDPAAAEGAVDRETPTRCYESALYATRGKPWLEGIILTPSDEEIAKTLLDEATVAWKP